MSNCLSSEIALRALQDRDEEETAKKRKKQLAETISNFEDWWEVKKYEPPYTPKEIARAAWKASESSQVSELKDELGAEQMLHSSSKVMIVELRKNITTKDTLLKEARTLMSQYLGAQQKTASYNSSFDGPMLKLCHLIAATYLKEIENGSNH